MIPAAQKIGNLQHEFVSDQEVITVFRDLFPNIKYDNVVWRTRRQVRYLHDEGIKSTTNRWHKDGDNYCVYRYHYPTNLFIAPYALIVWSNAEPTDILDTRTNEELKFDIGDIILIRNKIAMHRTPLKISDNRQFIRCWDVKIKSLGLA